MSEVRQLAEQLLNELRDTEARITAAKSQLAVLQGLHKQLHDDIAELQPRYLLMKTAVDKWKALASKILTEPAEAA